MIMNRPPNTSRSESSASSPLVQAFEEIACRLLQDPLADPDGLLADYPEHAEELRSMLPALKLLADAGSFDGALPASAYDHSAGRGSDSAGRGSPDPAQSPDRRSPDFSTSHSALQLGDFRILCELGRGGMGVVYEAEQLSRRRKLALKLFPFAGLLDQRQVARFENEARAAATLEYPNIDPVYAVGEERSVHYYAMR